MTGRVASTDLNRSQSRFGILHPSGSLSPCESLRITSTTASISAIRHLICSCRRVVSSFGCSGKSGQLHVNYQHTNTSTRRMTNQTYCKSLHCIQSTICFVPSAATIVELGLVPSRCSSTATTKPRLAISPQKALYMSREQPTPWLNSIKGHLPSWCKDSGTEDDGGIISGASFAAGKVVPCIAAAAVGSVNH